MAHLARYAQIAFCFLDAEKEIYGACYDLVIPRLVKGGLLVADNAINHREKEWNGRKGFQGLSDADTMRMAIDTLQKTIGQDFKPSDIEVGFVNGVQRTFRKLGAEEVEGHLQVIQRFD